MRPVPQPARGVIALRRLQVKGLAAEMGVSETHLRRVLNGWAPPSARVRASLSAVLGLPEDTLFRDNREWFQVEAAS